MTADPKDARSRAEERFDKAQKTTNEARAQIDSDLQAVRKKTSRLRALRLAKDAAEQKTEIDKKPAARKRKPALPK